MSQENDRDEILLKVDVAKIPIKPGEGSQQTKTELIKVLMREGAGRSFVINQIANCVPNGSHNFGGYWITQQQKVD